MAPRAEHLEDEAPTMSEETADLQDYAAEAPKALRRALFAPFVDAVVGRKIAQGEEIWPWVSKKYRPGPHPLVAYPGAGKSHMVVEIAEELREQLPVLFLGLSHKSFDNIPTNIKWDRWRPHSPTCRLLARATKGYDTKWYECDCDAARSREVKRPTFAPVEHVLTTEPDGMPLTPNSILFSLWIFDEVSTDRFIDTMVVTRRHLRDTAVEHPSQLIKVLAQALLRVLSAHSILNEGKDRFHSENWRGVDFYAQLYSALGSLGWSLSDFLNELPLPAEELEDDNWARAMSLADLPPNFAPRMLDIISVEAPSYPEGRPLNPRIHVVKDSPGDSAPAESIIRIRTRKYVPNYMLSVVLDATAEPVLLERAFGPVKKVVTIPPPAMPEAVHVRQLLHYNLGVTALSSGASRRKYGKLLQEEVRRYQRDVAEAHPLRVGILTFKRHRDHFRKSLRDIGIPDDDIVTGYFWNLRGDNDFFNPVPCDILAVIGYPRPNEETLYEEVCALFDDDETPISRERTVYDEPLQLRNGHQVTVKQIDGYEDDRLEALYRQKSRSELYQAFHRSRAYIEGGVKEILVFTQIPVPHAVVDSFIGMDGGIFDALECLLRAHGEATNTAVADAVLDSNSSASLTRDSLIKRITRAAQDDDGRRSWLCEATGTTPARRHRRVIS